MDSIIHTELQAALHCSMQQQLTTWHMCQQKAALDFIKSLAKQTILLSNQWVYVHATQPLKTTYNLYTLN